MNKPQFAVTRFYFTLFMPAAVTVAYLPIWLDHIGITEAQIGVLNAAPMAITLLLTVFVGRIADKATDWKQTILIGQALAALFAAFFGLADTFVTVLIAWVLAVSPAIMVGPVADAATIRLGQRSGFSFGTVRAWGTAGFLLISLVTGYLADWFGPNAFLWLFAGLSALRVVTGYYLPVMRDPTSKRATSGGAIITKELRQALRTWVLLPLIGASFIFSTHMIMNGFSALVWSNQGISAGTIGFLIALAAGAEAVTMLLWKHVEFRFTARSLLMLGGAFAILRWTLMTFEPSVPVLVLVQLLQAFSFTFAYLGGMYFIAKRTDESVSAEAQGFFAILMQTSSIFVVMAFGPIFKVFGSDAFFFSALVCFVGIALTFASILIQKDQT